ncbi:MAG: endonuclease/exonuclease/phosphatase family protein [Flavobacteriales bacterium]|nr:endonuclease/exonuclease/phosphatase family protein [Flavobacteriales bacterium]
MSFNIRYKNKRDGIDQWKIRKSELISFIDSCAPDILGIQEGLEDQVRFIDINLSNYSYIGVGRNDGKRKGEFNAIFYNHNKLKVVENATFWLSQKQNAPSIGWDASKKRICTYGVFVQKNDMDTILILNTHFDHKGLKARIESSKLILEKVKKINKKNWPVVLMGDFNSQVNSEEMALLVGEFKDASTISEGIIGPLGTYNGFKKNVIPDLRIDYILTKGVDVKRYEHLDDKMSTGHWLSDHLPVLIEY